MHSALLEIATTLEGLAATVTGVGDAAPLLAAQPATTPVASDDAVPPQLAYSRHAWATAARARQEQRTAGVDARTERVRPFLVQAAQAAGPSFAYVLDSAACVRAAVLSGIHLAQSLLRVRGVVHAAAHEASAGGRA